MIHNRDRGVVYLLAALLAAPGAIPPTQATAQELSGPAAEAKYRLGLIPIGVALTDEMQYPETNAIVLRRTGRIPHDVIVMRGEAASPELITQSVFTLYAAHRIDSACPSEDMVVRVTAHSGSAPPTWGQADAANLKGVLQRLQRKPLEPFEDLGLARLDVMWVVRFWNAHEGPPRGDGPPPWVCPTDTTVSLGED